MWVYTRSSFLSIVSDDRDPTMVVVRGRIAGDIQRLFPSAQVQKTPARDYAYRARISRVEVGEAVAETIRRIDYPNFKDAVEDRRRCGWYSQTWLAAADEQQRRLAD